MRSRKINFFFYHEPSDIRDEVLSLDSDTLNEINVEEINFVATKRVTYSDILGGFKTRHLKSYKGMEPKRAQQTCISCSKIINMLGYKTHTQNRGGPMSGKVSKFMGNHKFLIVNDTLKNFTKEQTDAVLNKMDVKQDIFNIEDYNASERFTETKVSIAAHGIGTTDDIALTLIRRMMLIGDTITFIAVGTTVYIAFRRNRLFFEIMDGNLIEEDKYLPKGITKNYRIFQTKYKYGLLDEVFDVINGYKCMCCNITKQELLIGSHIKAVADCKTHEEKADSQNGLLLCPNHDKLFDRKMISFNEDGSILISKNLSKNDRINLDLNDIKIDAEYLSEKRKKYLEHHRSVFNLKEQIYD